MKTYCTECGGSGKEYRCAGCGGLGSNCDSSQNDCVTVGNTPAEPTGNDCPRCMGSGKPGQAQREMEARLEKK